MTFRIRALLGAASGLLLALAAALSAGDLSPAGVAFSPADARQGQVVSYEGRQLTKEQFLIETRSKRNSASASRGDPATLENQYLDKQRARLAGNKPSPSLVARPGMKPLRPLPCEVPTVYSAEGSEGNSWSGSYVEPGGWVTLHGCGFRKSAADSIKGELRVLGSGFPGGQLVATGLEGYFYDKEYDIVFGHIPSIAGVHDQTVQVQFVTPANAKSNVKPVPFRARRVLKKLKGEDIQKNCSAAANENACYAWGEGPSLVDVTPGVFTVAGTHKEPAGEIIVGVDTFSCVLQNGWEFAEGYFGQNAGDGAGAWPLGLSFNHHKTLDLKVTWYSFGPHRAAYDVTLFIEGPDGLPHK